MTFVVYNRQDPVDIELCHCSDLRQAISIARMCFDANETVKHIFVNEEDSDGCVLREYIWEARR